MTDQQLIILSLFWGSGLIVVLINPLKLRLFNLAKAFALQLCSYSLVFSSWLFFNNPLAALIAVTPIFIFVIILIKSQARLKGANPGSQKTNFLSVLQINASYKNKHIEKLSDKVIKLDPDLVTFIEYHYPNRSRYDAKLKNNYPYSIIEPPDHPYGIGLYSKHPLEKKEVVVMKNQMVLSVRLKMQNLELNIIAAHPYPPIAKRQITVHEKIFESIHGLLKNKINPTIVMGDFNAVPWYSQMAGLVEKNNLTYSSTIWQATFPAWLPGLRIPIDHILFTRELQLLRCRRIRVPGSDHFGLLAEFK